MKAKTIDTTKKEKKTQVIRVASQFPETVPAMGQHHDGSNVNSLVTKQKELDKARSKQSLINDILKGTFKPVYSKKDPADLSKALQQVKEKMNGKPVAFRKAKQVNTLLVYADHDGVLIESINLGRRGYYSVNTKHWFARSQSLFEIADQYSEKHGSAVFCKKITISDYHYRQYVISEDIVNTINDRIDGITVFKQFTIFASGVALTDEQGDPIVLDSLELAKEFVKSL